MFTLTPKPMAGFPLRALVTSESARAVFDSKEHALQFTSHPGDIGPMATRYVTWAALLTPAELRRLTWLSARPTRNPIIEGLRDNWDSGDNWGSALRALFALCDVMSDLSVEIPEEWQFSQSPFGSDTEDPDYQMILADVEHMSTTDQTRVLTHAGWILQRLTRIYDAAGLSY